MTTRTIGPTVETLMRRVRQEGGLAVDPDLATKVYSYCEQCTNAFTKRVRSSTLLAIPKEKLLFNFRTEIADAIEITAVRESGRRIEKFTDLSQIAAYDIDWFRSIAGTRFEAWVQLGRDIFIVYPGQAAISAVTVEYVKLLTFYDDFAVAHDEVSELPDEDIEIALKLAEIVLLARFRQHNVLQRHLKAAGKLLGVIE